MCTWQYGENKQNPTKIDDYILAGLIISHNEQYNTFTGVVIQLQKKKYKKDKIHIFMKKRTLKPQKYLACGRRSQEARKFPKA